MDRFSTVAIVTLALLLAATPLVLIALAWIRWGSTRPPSPWRKWAMLAALVCSSLGALAQPVVFLILSLHQRLQWLDRIEISTINATIVVGFAASLLALPFALCGWGKVRWLAIPACLLSLTLCYISGMATSY